MYLYNALRNRAVETIFRLSDGTAEYTEIFGVTDKTVFESFG